LIRHLFIHKIMNQAGHQLPADSLDP
jgi:hypothetical protein